MPRVIVFPAGNEVECEVGQNLLEVSKQHSLGIHFSCDGVPSCATCRIVIKSGDEHLNEIEKKEEDLIGTTYWLTKQRLSCQAIVKSEGVIEIDVSEQLEKEKENLERKKIRAIKSENEVKSFKSSGGPKRNRPFRDKPKSDEGVKSEGGKGKRRSFGKRKKKRKPE